MATAEIRTPMRQCAGCRRRAPRGDLLRFVRGGSGELRIDLRSRLGGRGSYVHPCRPCLEKAAARRRGRDAAQLSFEALRDALEERITRDFTEASRHRWLDEDGVPPISNGVTRRLAKLRAWWIELGYGMEDGTRRGRASWRSSLDEKQA